VFSFLGYRYFATSVRDFLPSILAISVGVRPAELRMRAAMPSLNFPSFLGSFTSMNNAISASSLSITGFFGVLSFDFSSLRCLPPFAS
jgi:hypothetical protein